MSRLERSGRAPALDLPWRFGPRGPVSRRRVGRSLLMAGLVLAGASLLWGVSASPAWQAFALGLAFPGGGFVICGASAPAMDMTVLWIGGASAAAFGLALSLWFATGNVLGPPAVWLGAAVAASLYALHHGCLAAESGGLSVLGLTLAAGLVGLGLAFFRPVPVSTPGLMERPAARPIVRATASPSELGDDDLARLRFLLDRALQPLDRFDGFERLDPFQSAALRYQLQFAGFALAMVQRNHLPALQAYLTDAQANLIDKARAHRVWRYWAAESLWGRGRIDPNPFAADNVMYTGFCATQIALFQAASGDRRFSVPGAFSLTHPSGRRFEADFPSLVGNIAEQHARSDFGLIACEPNWLFPVCNSIGYAAIAAHDAQFGSGVWAGMAARQQAMLRSEFTDGRGRFVTCRSSHTGLAMPAIGGVLTQLLPSFFLNATLPGLAAENWQRLRGELIAQTGASTRPRLGQFWPIDVGNYRFTRIAGLCGAAATAVELGDREVAEAMLDALDARYPMATSHRIGHRPDASIWSHAFEIMARCGRQDGLRDLVQNPVDPSRAETSPHISACPYPAALVAKAAALDGQLDITLVPGSGAARVSLELAGLRRSRVYRRSDDASAFTSGPDGRASIDIHLTERRRITIREAA
ncbi:hypothetical protein [Aureimonas sp. AU20]|uniref:linalool dehydratase/isomerase domain-containing protein n=1 Tax=Aureimonas sp. AU20 TaxID=1349819 RepID=UPI0007228A8E|nr:hypothetical protein [Aureimonas sp. AU20]ALN75005.1 hypothetical protein M673_19955 [Aureimonas sp. AU20]